MKKLLAILALCVSAWGAVTHPAYLPNSDTA